jgi:hypothetical protein
LYCIVFDAGSLAIAEDQRPVRAEAQQDEFMSAELCLVLWLLLCSPRDTLGNKLASKVLERIFHKAPVFYRDGGTIPALAYFQSILGLDTTGFGFGLGDHIHAPNERTPVSQYHTGRTAYVEMLAELGQSWPAGSVKANRVGKKRRKVTKKSSTDSISSADEHDYDSASDKQEL